MTNKLKGTAAFLSGASPRWPAIEVQREKDSGAWLETT